MRMLLESGKVIPSLVGKVGHDTVQN